MKTPALMSQVNDIYSPHNPHTVLNIKYGVQQGGWFTVIGIGTDGEIRHIHDYEIEGYED